MVHRGRTSDPLSSRASRRRTLALVGTSLAAALSGCSALPDRTLDDPTEETRSNSTILEYSIDGERLAEVSLVELWRGESDADAWRYPFRTNVWHADGYSLRRLAYTFRPIGANTPPEFYLKRPGGHPWEPIEFSRGDDPDETVLEVPELGFQGQGSVAFELIAAVYDEEPFELRVDVEATLDADGLVGRDVRIEGSMRHPFPGRTGGD